MHKCSQPYLAPEFRVCQQCGTSLPLLVERALCDSLDGIRKDEQHSQFAETFIQTKL